MLNIQNGCIKILASRRKQQYTTLNGSAPATRGAYFTYEERDAMDDAMKKQQAQKMYNIFCQALDASDWKYKEKEADMGD